MVTTPLVIGAVDAIANLEVDVEAQPADDQDKVDVPEAKVAEDEIGGDDDVIIKEEKASVAITVEPRRSERISAGVNVPVTKVKKSEWGERDASDAVQGELKQLLHEELNALKPVKSVPPGAVILESHMFVTKKYSATGEYEKTKARLVADGRGQDAKLYPDKSSPTLASHSMWIVLAMYAGLSGYLMLKVDVKGAFLETSMEGGPNMCMGIRKDILRYLLLLYPEYQEYIQDDGSILMLLLKAMYGCVQASKLWYTLLTSILRGRGYAVSENDPCVWRRVVDGVIYIILIYVDDLLIFGNQEEMDGLSALLTASFSAITMTIGQELSYLGMQIEWTPAGFQVSMEYYIEQMLKDWPGVIFRTGLGTKDTYKIDGESRLLAEKDRKLFHSAVARVLYLAKHVRPDALTVVSFLYTRVTVATEQDQAKLERLLCYFKSTKAQKYYIRVCGLADMQVRMFVDAAFALH